MSAADFSRGAEEWLKGAENIPCSGWVGTILQTETVDSTATSGTAGPGPTTSREETQIASRTVKVFVNGGVRVEITFRSKETIVNTIVQDGCTVVGQSTADIHPKGGDETVGEAQQADILFTQGGRYYIQIQGPDEVNERVERSTLSMCALGVLPENATKVDLAHPGWVFGMDGVLPDPSNRTRLNGITRDVIRTGHDAWLTGSGGVVPPFQGRGNGSESTPVEVKVTTEWDLRRLR
jgi:hypothetical protein